MARGAVGVAHKLAFGWVLHQHQPVGNFPWVFEQVYDVCYVPLLELLERHPQARVSLHYSGPLLDWLLAAHPDYVTRVAALVARDQVEMLTSGYYEPILPVLPTFDQHGQITKMNTAIRRHFGYNPTGLWLTERVWEPTLPSALASAGVRYTILDDTHFIMAGLTEGDMFGYYMTEDQGHPLRLFPNPKVIRDAIPWRSVRAVATELRRIHDEAQGAPRVVVLGDDGEKFGSWPSTFDRMWRRGYMDRLLTMFAENSDWLELVHLSEYMQREAPLGRVYVPTASYAEMMEWALPAKRSAVFTRMKHDLHAEGQHAILGFMHGGTWRNFAAKYAEANNFHKKMLRVHNKIRDVAAMLGPNKTQAALDELWKGQCNCGYWHGLFGGLYLADIRSAIYQHLIRAEAIADGALPTTGPTATLTDFDCDGRDELLIEGPQMDVYLAPHDGGTIFEWDWKQRPFNVVDTLARRPEAYHEKLLAGHVKVVPPGDPTAPPEVILSEEEEDRRRDAVAASIHDLVQAKEPGLEKLLHYDPYRRALLREHFFTSKTTWQQMETVQYDDLGDFAGAPFAERVEGTGSHALAVELWRDGTVRAGKHAIPVRLRKHITLVRDAAELHVTYTLHNTGAERLRTRFAIEGNWGMLGGGHNPVAWYEIDGAKPETDAALDEAGTATGIHTLALVNTGVGVRVTLIPGTPADLWRFPVETVSNSEAGFERGYQCSCTVLHWPVDLAPGDRWSVTLRMAITAAE
jgi:alpha-amylase/alpha-mannosidase (GH57 family)